MTTTREPVTFTEEKRVFYFTFKTSDKTECTIRANDMQKAWEMAHEWFLANRQAQLTNMGSYG